MRTRRYLALTLILLAACATGGTNPATTPTPGEAPTPTPAASPSKPDPAPEGPPTLRLWLPPRFSPDPNTPAGALLKTRLDEFSILHPEIRIIIRLKAESGAGGMVDALTAAAAALPAIRPDLILIPRPEMETAVDRGLLAPLDALDDDWYDFARQLASRDNAIYGLPFTADALGMLYRVNQGAEPPRDWTMVINAAGHFAFAAASPQSLYTVALYQAAGGQLADAGGALALEAPRLAAVLNFYRNASTSGAMPAWVTELQDEAEVAQVFNVGNADYAITWASEYLRQPMPENGMTSLPTVGSLPYTLITGWSWVLGNPASPNLAISRDLLAFLSDPAFMAVYTQAAGYLPTRPSALGQWQESPGAAVASRMILTGHLMPPGAALGQAGWAFQLAISDVLLLGISPADAATAAVSGGLP
jgi:ABC-type glycerol-3-phosphate transport system substrate-binding protein